MSNSCEALGTLTPWETHPWPGDPCLREELWEQGRMCSLWLKYSLFSQVPGVGPEAPLQCCGYPVPSNVFEDS